MKKILKAKGGKQRVVKPVKGQPASKTKPAALIGTGSKGKVKGKGKGLSGMIAASKKAGAVFPKGM